jgi:hypothetical protein
LPHVPWKQVSPPPQDAPWATHAVPLQHPPPLHTAFAQHASFEAPQTWHWPPEHTELAPEHACAAPTQRFVPGSQQSPAAQAGRVLQQAWPVAPQEGAAS